MNNRSGVYGEKRRDALIGAVTYSLYYISTLGDRIYNSMVGITEGDQAPRTLFKSLDDFVKSAREGRISRTLRARIPDSALGM